MRKRENCTAKRIIPAAREIMKVVIVVPTFVWAVPAEPLAVPFRMEMMSDILMLGSCYRYCMLLGGGNDTEIDICGEMLLSCGAFRIGLDLLDAAF